MDYSQKLMFILSLGMMILGHGSLRAETQKPEYKAQEVPLNWALEQAKRDTELADYIQANQRPYDWFSKFAFSQTDGTPYIMLKLLPILAPELWGSQSNFLDRVGLFIDEREPSFPIARGIGISVFNRDNPLSAKIDYATFTCAACHFGRAKKEQGKVVYLDGGVNSEFNVVQFRVNVYKTLQKIFQGETDKTKKANLFVAALLKSLETIEAQDPNYFYNHYSYKNIVLDTEYEKKQIELFKERALTLASQFITKTEKNYQALIALRDNSYNHISEKFVAGFPGMVDASGFGTSSAYVNVDGFFSRLLAYFFILPPTAGITDFQAVWEQNKRAVSWDKTKTKFHSGGGQWNGNIPIPIYRNIAAQLSVGLADNDLRVAAYSVKLLDNMPAPVYPFDVDLELAKKGKDLFEQNCLNCHRPNNGTVYSSINTNMDRAQVITEAIRKAGADRLIRICSEKTVIKVYGKETTPCAQYKTVSLKGKDKLIMPDPNDHLGYNALPLGGIWSQGPYLHNGSVPTLYHLLVPTSRPSAFVKSRIDYDQSKLGYSWQLPFSEKDKKTKAYIFDTTLFPAFSNQGHDTDIKQGSKTYKLNWSDDIDGAMALIEYLKTF